MKKFLVILVLAAAAVGFYLWKQAEAAKERERIYAQEREKIENFYSEQEEKFQKEIASFLKKRNIAIRDIENEFSRLFRKADRYADDESDLDACLRLVVKGKRYSVRLSNELKSEVDAVVSIWERHFLVKPGELTSYGEEYVNTSSRERMQKNKQIFDDTIKKCFIDADFPDGLERFYVRMIEDEEVLEIKKRLGVKTADENDIQLLKQRFPFVLGGHKYYDFKVSEIEKRLSEEFSARNPYYKPGDYVDITFAGFGKTRMKGKYTIISQDAKKKSMKISIGGVLIEITQDTDENIRSLFDKKLNDIHKQRFVNMMSTQAKKSYAEYNEKIKKLSIDFQFIKVLSDCYYAGLLYSNNGELERTEDVLKKYIDAARKIVNRKCDVDGGSASGEEQTDEE